MTYVFLLSVILFFSYIYFSCLMTALAQAADQDPSMAIEDTYVPQSKERIKANESESKLSVEEKVPANKGKTSGKKAKTFGKRDRGSSNHDGPTAADVRAAKKEQGLKGYFFQDSKSKKYFLQDFDGNMYKFVENKWVKIKEAED